MFFSAAIAADPHTTWEFVVAIFNIVWIDLVLAGDNAVVIALAVRGLPARQRMWGILLGAGAAVVLRAGLTLIATHLLTLRFVQLGGGLLILWIAFKLLKQGESEHGEGDGGANTLWGAVWMILVADITMSLDNVLAVAGAARGHGGLIYFGLALSIPLVVFASNLISRLMARYQIVIFLGAAILGKVAGDMIMTDPFTVKTLLPVLQQATEAATEQAFKITRYLFEAALVVAIFLFGWLRRRKQKAEVESVPTP